LARNYSIGVKKGPF